MFPTVKLAGSASTDDTDRVSCLTRSVKLEMVWWSCVCTVVTSDHVAMCKSCEFGDNFVCAAYKVSL